MPSTDPDIGTCDQPECRAPSTGDCIEGFHDLSLCPHYAGSDSTKGDAEVEEVVKHVIRPTLESRDLYLGSELDYASSIKITQNSLARIVVLAGPNDSGKTTLLASIFDHYLNGPIAEYLFAGSETLPAFDERCHLSRTDSGRETEDTERTKSFSEETMLHLRVRDRQLAAPIRDVLLSDIRGELFRDAMNVENEATRMKVVQRADHLAVLIDGEKIADLSTRNSVTTAAKTMLRRFIEARMIGAQTSVQIVFTKDDLIRATERVNKTSEFLDATEEEIRKRVESHVGALHFMRIMAREGEGLESYGVPELFSMWLRDSRFLSTVNPEPKSQRLVITSSRDFDRFGYRLRPDKFERATEY